MPSTAAAAMPAAPFDREAELRALDATASGVSGLVASGVTEIPRIFRLHDPEPQREPAAGEEEASLPVIDLSMEDHAALVAAIWHAASEWGFFQVVGHGVPPEVTAATIAGVRAFHEAGGGEGTEKARLYTRDPSRKVRYNCNHDLYKSKVASWRDTLELSMGPDPPAPEELPENCRDILIENSKQMKNLKHKLFGLLSEALGLNPSHLTDIACNNGQLVACHYYPPCPNPELVMGTAAHTDTSFLSVLVQDDVGGLQVLYEGKWVEVKPIPGAFIVNIGDLLKVLSNDKLQSVDHKVVLKKTTAARVSMAYFATDPKSTKLFGPIKELLSEENPPLYRETSPLAHYAQKFSRPVHNWAKKPLDYLRLPVNRS